MHGVESAHHVVVVAVVISAHDSFVCGINPCER